MNEKIKFQVTGPTYVIECKTGKVVHTFHSAKEVMDFEKQAMQKKLYIATSALCQYPNKQEQTGTMFFRSYTKSTGFTIYDAFNKKLLFQATSYKKTFEFFVPFIKANCQTLLTLVDSQAPSAMPLYVVSNNKYPREAFKKAIKDVLKNGFPSGPRFH